jgi:hypothetical protein
MQLGRSLYFGSTSTLIAILLLAGLVLRPDAAHALSFNLIRSPESIGSWFRPSDSAIKYFDPGTVLNLELPTSGGTLQSGAARITNFQLPAAVNNFGLYFSFTSVPSVIEGTVVVSGDEAEISFPSISVDFERGSFMGNANPGTLVFDLTTAGASIPVGCAGRTEEQEIPGVPLDLVTGELGLVAAVCPYLVDNDGTPLEYNNAFRLALQGSVALTAVPEPGTLALLATGLLFVAAGARRGRAA